MTSVLGISAFYHDSAAAIIVDGKIIAAAQEERFTRKKHDASYPKNVTRNSLAVYYLCEPRDKAVNRGKALFALYKNQINDPDLLDLVKKRGDISQSSKVYSDKK